MKAVVLQESPGGRRVIKEGGVVVRPCYPSSPSVHRLLRHLEGVGFSGAPRLIDTDGTVERLGFIAGDSGADAWTYALPDAGLFQMARLLRSYHEAVAGFHPDPTDRWSSGGSGLAPGQVVLHGDPGPWNFVWQPDGSPIALIDWDHANPGDPLDDLAYLAAYAAPLAADDAEATTWMRHSAAPDRGHRTRVLAEGYGVVPDGLIDRAIEVMAKTNRTVEHMARQGLEPQRTWAAEGKMARLWERHSWMVSHREEFARL